MIKLINKCPECNENVNPEDTFCHKCGLVFDDSPVYDDSGFSTFNAPLGNGVELEYRLTRVEKKYGWNSPSANRYNKFKERYYNIFEEELLKHGFSLAEIDVIFLNDFSGWYKRNSKKIGGMKRKDVINRFLEFNMV